MLQPSAVARMPVPALLRRFILVYLPAAIVLTIAIYSSIRFDIQDRVEKAKVREAARVDVAKNLVARDFSTVTSDLRLLAVAPSLRRFLDHDGGERFDELANLFLEICRISGNYDQVRYLDNSGHEIVRINFNEGTPSIVPRSQLQDKSGRYFFRDSIKLDRHQVFVSPLDLNIEHDQLELPYKPMIRFGMPVFDSAGHKRGVVLLNYFGEELLRHFRDVMRSGDRRSGMLLNRDGYWLSSEKQDEEWGFMLGKPELKFGKRYPDVWNAISTSDNGTIQTDAGLFVYSTVYPLQAGQHSSSGSPLPRSPSKQELTAREYHWKIVSFTPYETFTEAAEHNQVGRDILYGVAYLLLAIGSLAIAFYSLSRKQERVRVEEEEARLREIAVTMSDGLLVADLEGKITFANPEACQLLGYSESELIGADMHGTLHVHDDGKQKERHECSMLRVARTGETYRAVEEIFRCKDGKLLPISVSVSAIIREQQAAGIVVAFHDITERKKFEQELERRAQIDALTALNNRRHFYELAEQEILRTKRYGKQLALVMLDVDHFKNINDTYGHHVGDEVLQRLGAVCLQTMREIDIIGRLGGEEFAILLPEATAAQALDAAERLRLAVAAMAIALEQGQSLSFTISVGVTGLVAKDSDIADMLKRADEAMYQAKRSGRNQVCIKE